MSALFATGAIVDLILGFVLVEALVLLWLGRGRVPGFAPADVAALLLPGVALMLALRASLAGAAWTEVAAWLAASLLAHGLDLLLRFGRRASSRR